MATLLLALPQQLVAIEEIHQLIYLTSVRRKKNAADWSASVPLAMSAASANEHAPALDVEFKSKLERSAERLASGTLALQSYIELTLSSRLR